MKFLRESWAPDRWCHCDPVDIVANVATGGLYGVGKGIHKAVTTGKILAGVSDALATVGIAGNVLQPTIGTKNTLMLEGAVAGGALAAAPAGSVFSGGFGAASPGVAPLAASPGVGGLEALAASGPVTAANIPASGVPLAPGVAPSAAEVAGASLTGPVGAPAAAPGLLSQPSAPWASMNTPGGWESAANPMRSIPKDPGAVSGWWANLPELGKYAVLAGGTQLLAGGASGLFAGMSAEQKLNLEKLINEQNQTQRQRLNTQNAYAPALKFQASSRPAGLLTTPA